MSILNYATLKNVTVSTTNCAPGGGKITLSLDSTMISSVHASGYDIVPYAPDGVTVLTFSRISFTAPSTATLIVTLPTGSTGASGRYTITIASGYASATDQSTAVTKSGPSGNNAILWWPMQSSDTSSIADTIGSNTLTLSGGASLSSTSICKIPSTGATLPGKSLVLDGISGYAASTTTATNTYSTKGHMRTVTLHVTIKWASYAQLATPQYIVCAGISGYGGPAIYVNTSRKLRVAITNGVDIVGTTSLVDGQIYDITLVMNTVSCRLYLNGVLEASGRGGYWTGGGTAAKLFFGCDARSSGTGPLAGTYVAGTWDNIWMTAETYTPEYALAAYNCNLPPIGTSPKRKLTRVNQGGSLAEGQLIPQPVSGFGAGTNNYNGMQEPCAKYNASGWPGVSGNPKWIMTLTEASSSAKVGWATCSSDPRVGTNWTVNTSQIVGYNSLDAGPAMLNDWVYDSSQSKYLLIYSTSFGTGGAVKGTFSTDFATWGTPKTLIAANSLQNCISSGVGFVGYNNHRVLPMTGGGWVMFLEASGTGYPFGGIRTIALTSPNLNDNGDDTIGTWTYSSSITGTTGASSTALGKIVDSPSGSYYPGNSPGAIQYGNVTYLTHRINGSWAITGATTDTTNFTTVTTLNEPLLEGGVPADVVGNGGIDDPRIATDGTSTYILHVLGSNEGAGGGNSLIGMAYYEGTPDQLFATGSTSYALETGERSNLIF